VGTLIASGLTSESARAILKKRRSRRKREGKRKGTLSLLYSSLRKGKSGKGSDFRLRMMGKKKVDKGRTCTQWEGRERIRKNRSPHEEEKRKEFILYYSTHVDYIRFRERGRKEGEKEEKKNDFLRYSKKEPPRLLHRRHQKGQISAETRRKGRGGKESPQLLAY